jgi:hypothetical protein
VGIVIESHPLVLMLTATWSSPMVGLIIFEAVVQRMVRADCSNPYFTGRPSQLTSCRLASLSLNPRPRGY